MSELRPRLGKGLEALIPKSVLMAGKTIANIPMSHVKPNPYQPRTHFDTEALKTLSESIKTHGLNQPIVVRRQGNYYELIAGERRFRASQLAGLDVIPAIVKDVTDKESLQIALIENLEREDLNCIEEAKGYARLIKEFQLTHQDVSGIFGKSRSAVSNTLRLLQLPESIQAALFNQTISEGHARTLLALDSEQKMLEALNLIKEGTLNVRQIESHIAQLKKKHPKTAKTKTEAMISLEQALIKIYSKKKVKVKGDMKKGKIEILYHSEEELAKLFDKLSQ